MAFIQKLKQMLTKLLYVIAYTKNVLNVNYIMSDVYAVLLYTILQYIDKQQHCATKHNKT